MMTKLEQAAMQAAWVWMDWYSSNNGTLEPVDFNETITALREALEQPDEIDWIETNKALAKEIIELKKQAEQEPVAWWNGKETVWFEHELITDGPVGECKIPLYAAPVRTKDLTDECNLLKDHLSDAKEIIQKLMKERDALVANNKPSAFSVARKRLAKLDQHVRT